MKENKQKRRDLTNLGGIENCPGLVPNGVENNFLCYPREELHLQTLKAFVDLHEFSNLNLVQALRSASIFPPSQLQDTIMTRKKY